MKTAFVATVGMGTGPESDITKPLVQSIREANPGFLLLFATEGTRENAACIGSELGRTDGDSPVHVLKSPKDDVELLFKEMLDEVSGLLRARSIRPEDTAADYTTGTKPMSAALVLVAVRLGLGSVKYISVRRGEDKRPLPGTERTLTFVPRGFAASLVLRSALDLMQGYRFDTVLRLLAPLPDHLLSHAEQDLKAGLLALASAYLNWDLFRHIRFQAAHGKAKLGHVRELEQFRASAGTLSAVHRLGELAARGQLSDLAVADLINNALRRIEEGKYDDATARLYRACEMLGQWRLLTRYGLDSSNIDLTKVKKESVDWLNSRRRGSRTEIGLRDVFTLLKELEDTLGRQFWKDPALQALLEKRNQSILAHGMVPVEENDCRKLAELVTALARSVTTRFDDSLTLLRFPWST